MIPIDGSVRIFVATQPIDFRAGINRLMGLVTHVLGHDACTGDVFVFRNKGAGAGWDDGAERASVCCAAVRPGLDQIARCGGKEAADLWLNTCVFVRIGGRIMLCGSMFSSTADLPRDIEKLSALVRALQAENEQLRALLKRVTQQAFGALSERGGVVLGDQGVILDRSAPSRWMRKLSWWLRPLYQVLLAYSHSLPRIFCDEIRMPIQEKGRRRVRNTQFWAHACDDRPWKGPAHPAVVYIHARGRGHDEARQQLAGYSGTIQVDGYDAYKALVRSGPTRERIRLAFCLAHARRKFIDAWRKSPSPIAQRIIASIGEVYAIEARIRGMSAHERQHVRQLDTSAPMARIMAEIDEMLPHLSPKSDLAKAMRYTLSHWQGLNRFLEDGKLEVDTNTVERGMRSVAQGGKSSLLAGSDGGAETWAILASLLQTARLNGLDPFTWLNDVLTRIVTGQVKSNDLACLLPWAWTPATNHVHKLAA